MISMTLANTINERSKQIVRQFSSKFRLKRDMLNIFLDLERKSNLSN